MRRIIRLKEVLKRVSYSKATLYRKIAQGKFPRPARMDGDGSAVGFDESAVDAWIADLFETRDKKAAAALSEAFWSDSTNRAGERRKIVRHIHRKRFSDR